MLYLGGEKSILYTYAERGIIVYRPAENRLQITNIV